MLRGDAVYLTWHGSLNNQSRMIFFANKAMAISTTAPSILSINFGESLKEPKNEPAKPPATTAMISGMKFVRSMELYCRRDIRPDSELSQIKMAPQAAVLFHCQAPG